MGRIGKVEEKGIAYLKKCKQGETEPGSQLAATDPHIASDHDDQPSEE